MTLAFFDTSHHPRGQHGKFVSASGMKAVASAGAAARGHSGPSFMPLPLAEATPGANIQRRSPTRGEAWQRIGSRIDALPIDYTGKREKERPVGSYEKLRLDHQIPAGMDAEDHLHRLGRFVRMVKDQRKQIIEDATKNRVGKKHVFLKASEPASGGRARWRMKPDKFPEDTPPATLHRAYNHAALLAMHDAGLVDYDFKMDDALKDELQPTEPFIRYARQRLNQASSTTMPGERRQYVAAFGKPFADLRTDKVTGEVRRRLRPNQQLIKADGISAAARLTLFRAFGALEQDGQVVAVRPEASLLPLALVKGDQRKPLRAAGIMLVSGPKDAPRILLLKRSMSSSSPGNWCFPGGKVEKGETAAVAARRETLEESGAEPPTVTHVGRRLANGVDFTAFRAQVPDDFEPTLNEEHTDWQWVDIDHLPSPMLPACVAFIDKLRPAPLNKAFPRLARRAGTFALGAIDRQAMNTDSVAHSAGHAIGGFVARTGRSIVRNHVKFARNTVAEGARFGAGFASGAAGELGASRQGLRRAARIGAVVGGGKLAVEAGYVAHKPIMHAYRALTGQTHQPTPMAKADLLRQAQALAKAAPAIAAKLLRV